MQRLNEATLGGFLRERGVSAVMFGAPRGEATMIQAVEFADAWLDCHNDAGFGYVDAFDNVAAARDYGVRVLPTTVVFDGGEIVAWIEGRHASGSIVQAIRATLRAPAAVAA